VPEVIDQPVPEVIAPPPAVIQPSVEPSPPPRPIYVAHDPLMLKGRPAALMKKLLMPLYEGSEDTVLETIREILEMGAMNDVSQKAQAKMMKVSRVCYIC
jgi:hypothetical protein